jgi:polysaccharide biosynthesis/export protein
MNRYVRVLWVALIPLFFLAGCSPGSGLPELAANPDVSYHLGPGDSLLIRVLGADELNGVYTVQDDGTIRMLLISAVPAAGLTQDQVQTRIEEKLRTGRFLTKQQVSVAVTGH